MRPLPAPWTHEDFMILTAQWEGRDWKRDKLYPLAHSAVYDRRDAEWMFRVLVNRIPARIDTWKARNRWPMEGRFTRAWVNVTVEEMGAAGVDITKFA
jgi:hypothetical protein